jgi:hypothetical protein
MVWHAVMGRRIVSARLSTLMMAVKLSLFSVQRPNAHPRSAAEKTSVGYPSA